MTKNTFKKYSKSKVKLFLLFLLLASIFWVLTKFGREFTTSMEATINYSKLPETAALAEENMSKISYDLTANGFEILFYKFKKPTLDVVVEDYYEKEKNSFTISKNDLIRNLSSSFNKYMEIKNISPERLNVKLDPIVLKKVTIDAKTDILFKDGYKAIDEYSLQPDFATISGPKGIIEKIDTVYTETVSLKNVDQNISETVKIIVPTNEIVALTPNEIDFKWPVAEFSQGQFTLPVEVVNLPPGIDLKLVPERITVSFDIAVDDFATVSSNSFKVICDYSNRNKDDNFMLPKLAKVPKGAVNILFEPKKVDYFIFK